MSASVVNTETLRGGLAGTDPVDLPMGVFLLTERGLVFLPGDQGRLEGVIGDLPAGMVMEVAGMVFTPVDVLNQLQSIKDLDGPTTLGEWVRESLMHRHAFVIPWGDLTHVLVGAESMVLTREAADGTRTDHVILDGSRVWPTFLMQQRIVSDLREAVFSQILRPKIEALLPEVVAEWRGRGEDVAGDDSRAKLEAASRALAGFTAAPPQDTEAVVKLALAPALAGYAILPKIVENQPWLFADLDRAARAEDPGGS